MPKKKQSENITESRCAVCNSQYRATIEQMQADRLSAAKIRAWLKKRDPKLRISVQAINSHNRKHRMPAIKDMADSLTKNSTQNASSPPAPQLDEAKQKAIQAILNNNPLTVSQFCDLVIAKTTELIVNGQMNPTVADANKAAELKQRIKSGSPFESQLVTLFMDISKNQNLVNIH